MSGLAPRRRRRDRRNLIEEAAAEMFAEHGHAGIGVNEIAKRVGITGAAIYRHFSSKDELLETVLEVVLREFCDVADGAGAASPEQQIERLVRGMVRLTLSRAAHVATYLRERRRLSGAARERLRAQERRLFAAWKVILQSANPELGLPEIAVRQRAVNGALLALALWPAAEDRPDVEALLLGALSAVLLAPPAPTDHATAPERTRWRLPLSRRPKIVRAAAELFRQRGYHGVGVDQIGEAVGIAGPTIYRVYASKSDILLDVCDLITFRVYAETDRALDEASSAQEALDQMVAAYVAAGFTDTDLLIVAGRDHKALHPSDQARIGRRRADMLHLWSKVICEVRPELPEVAARVLVRSFFTMIQQIALGAPSSPADSRTTLPLALAFLAAPAAPAPVDGVTPIET